MPTNIWNVNFHWWNRILVSAIGLLNALFFGVVCVFSFAFYLFEWWINGICIVFRSRYDVAVLGFYRFYTGYFKLYSFNTRHTVTQRCYLEFSGLYSICIEIFMWKLFWPLNLMKFLTPISLLTFVQQPCMTQNWEVNINFKVSGKGKELFGDGFAIWYARDRLVPGPVFGSKDNFMGLAIILDTYSNHNGPHNVRNIQI